MNALTSPNSVVPFDYYHRLFNFCAPEKPKPSGGSLGAILFGDRKYDSLFQLYMRKNTTCNVLCTQKNDKSQTNFLIARIQERYLLNWCGSGCAACVRRRGGETTSQPAKPSSAHGRIYVEAAYCVSLGS